MFNINNILLSTYIRFCMVGVNFFILFAIIPVVLINPQIAKECISISNLLSLLIVSLSFGLVIDSLQLNRRLKNYKLNSENFQEIFTKHLGVDDAEFMVYFVKMSQVERKYGLGHIDFTHSRWVALGVSSYLIKISSYWYIFFATTLPFAMFFGFFKTYHYSQSINLTISAIICWIIASKIEVHVDKTQTLLQGMIKRFCIDNKDLLLSSDLEIVYECEKKKYELTSHLTRTRSSSPDN